MNSREIRKKFLDFFGKKKHKIVPSSSLIPTDPSVLFTTAGMQQFKPYFLGEKSPWGQNVASVQKCLRTSDIDEVGDARHLTFFEMLGNFSFGGYWKKEAIQLAWEFLAEILPQECKIQNSKVKTTNQDQKLFVTVFGGDKEIPADEESYSIWRGEIGIPEELIKRCGREDNFWGPTGAEGPCGPTTEIYVNGVEIWNIVFNEYYCDKDGQLTPLRQKGVDTGMGLERLAMVLQGKKSVFETDLFAQAMVEIKGNEREKRIIADHVKSAVFLAVEGIFPSNVGGGYVLRKLLRRAIRYGKNAEMPSMFLLSTTKKAIEIYQDAYPELLVKQSDILATIQKEEEKFEKTLNRGLKFLRENVDAWTRGFQNIPFHGGFSFLLYESYGFPPELTLEELKKYPEVKKQLNEKEYWEIFNKNLEKHQRLSRAGREKKFGGHGLILDTGEVKAANEEELKKVTRLHTATHLLQAALRQALGREVHQAGSDISAERLRFDFTFSRKLTARELAAVEQLVQEKIDEDLEVNMQERLLEEALVAGALTVPGAHYPSNVKVYSIGNFSKEVCGGPHVEHTKQIGQFRIVKEESAAAGIRRIRAAID